jgi:hypothetical protein
MSPPLRPNTAASRLADHQEPGLGAPGVEPLRGSAPRLTVAKPAAETVGTPPIRFPGEARHSQDLPHLSVASGDRLIMSSQGIAGDGKPRRSLTRVVGFAVLLVLAGFGAFTLYHWVTGAFLP